MGNMQQFLVTATVPIMLELSEEHLEDQSPEDLIEEYFLKMGMQGAIIHAIEKIPQVKH